MQEQNQDISVLPSKRENFVIVIIYVTASIPQNDAIILMNK